MCSAGYVHQDGMDRSITQAVNSNFPSKIRAKTNILNPKESSIPKVNKYSNIL